MIYLDNAATSFPKPPQVLNAAVQSIKRHGNPGRGAYAVSFDAANAVYAARKSAAEFLGSPSPERVVFTMNTTYALNMAMRCFDIKNKRILISCFEHNSVARPAFAMMSEGCRTDIFNVDLYNDDITVANALAAVRDDTAMAVITHVSNICGKILPAAKIITELKKRNPGMIIIIDAAQSAGTIPVDINKLQADAICVPAHKGLLGISGCGFILFGDNVDMKHTFPYMHGGSGTNSLELHMPDDPPERFEAGTLNVPAIAALSAGIGYINLIGREDILRREQLLYDSAYNELSCLSGIELYGGTSRQGFAGALLFNVCGTESEAVASFLADNGICVRAGLHCCPLGHKRLRTDKTGAVRISFGPYNSYGDVAAFISALKKMPR